MQDQHFDVLIVGAGLSGIGAGYHLQTNCPGKSYAILEGRDRIGGTWDLFRYPGIRSDSDMYTLGYSFRPWTEPKAIADGPWILNYVRETAAENGIDKQIRFDHRVKRASWSSQEARWTVEAERARARARAETVRFTCNFLFMCSGYYNYAAGYTPEFAGAERFRRPHRASAEMDRRSRLRGQARGGDRLRRHGGDAGAGNGEDGRARHHAAALADLCGVAAGAGSRRQQAARASCRRSSPITSSAGAMCCSACISFSSAGASRTRAKQLILGGVRMALGPDYDVATHFTPRYNPWDQRLCLVPDGDLFKAIKQGNASVVTDHIETLHRKGIRLKDGRSSRPTSSSPPPGLKLQLLGGMEVDASMARRSISPRR